MVHNLLACLTDYHARISSLVASLTQRVGNIRSDPSILGLSLLCVRFLHSGSNVEHFELLGADGIFLQVSQQATRDASIRKVSSRHKLGEV
jgi:hypothetical protein